MRCRGLQLRRYKSNQLAFTETGSYFADWELPQGELWVQYERSRDGDLSAECPDGYETVYVRDLKQQQD